MALLKPAAQSSIKSSRGPSLAVDGNKNPNAERGGSCSVMGSSLHPWWRVDLGSTFQLKEVSVSQRNSNRKLLYVFITYILIPLYKLDTCLDSCQVLPTKQYAGTYINTSVNAFLIRSYSRKKKGKFLYSAVFSPQDRSKRFTLYFPDIPIHSDTISASLGSIQPYATIYARRLLVHISTIVYSQGLMYTAE